MSRLIEFFERSVTIFFRLKKFFDDFSEKMQVLRKKPEMTAHNRVGGCFSITPLTTPYVRIRIRRFQFE